MVERGPSGRCGYTSKKQLVKRHIETTHLKFKSVPLKESLGFGILTLVIRPFICDMCEKAFPQVKYFSTSLALAAY